MRISLAPALLLATATALALPAHADERERALLVLDASGSMWGQVDGRAKIEIAREAVDTLLAGWKGGDLGLMAYGHRRKGDCNDIELLQPVSAFDAAALRGRVAALRPRGMTPITASVRQAAEQLRFTEQKATVILVSDGEETCKADPCALGKELEAMGVDFTAHVVGFDLPEGPARQQLQCLATGTGGRYLEARDAADLNAALGELGAAPKPAAIPVKNADAWIPGYSLVADVDQYLDGEADSGPGNVDFTVDQTARDCQALCEADDRCAGWHYEPTGSFFVPYPRCHMKGRGFAVRLEPQGEDWVAGVKPGVKLVRDAAAQE